MDSQNKAALFLFGRPFSPIYSAGMMLRAYLYKKNICKRKGVNLPVISVGNLTMGGNGKTPLVIYLARFLSDKGYTPAIVSRGYHGNSKNPVNIVSDGQTIRMTADAAGDEPVLMANRVEGTLVATGKNRHAVSTEVIRSYQCDVVILDDGFQHLSMARDIDLVLFDVNHFAGNSRVFPGGELRETVSALNRCHAFIITGVNKDNSERAAKCENLLQTRFADKPVFQASTSYCSFIKYFISPEAVDKSVVDLSAIPENLFGFSGIAQPDRFYRMLSRFGFELSGRKIFEDHYSYSINDIKNLTCTALETNASGFITTEKDMVRLTNEHHCPLPFYVPILEYLANEYFESFIINNLKDINRF